MENRLQVVQRFEQECELVPSQGRATGTSDRTGGH
jgi:hypothetical protein